MRITRFRDLHPVTGGYFNPESLARNLHQDLKYTNYAISRGQAYRETIDELFAPYAFPGGYPLLATTDSGDVFCMDCAKKVYLDEKQDINIDIYYEGSSLYCDDCNVEIESAYGDPDEEEE